MDHAGIANQIVVLETAIAAQDDQAQKDFLQGLLNAMIDQRNHAVQAAQQVQQAEVARAQFQQDAADAQFQLAQLQMAPPPGAPAPQAAPAAPPAPHLPPPQQVLPPPVMPPGQAGQLGAQQPVLPPQPVHVRDPYEGKTLVVILKNPEEDPIRDVLRSFDEIVAEHKSCGAFKLAKAIRGALPSSLQAVINRTFEIVDFEKPSAVGDLREWLVKRYPVILGTEELKLEKEWDSFKRTTTRTAFIDEFNDLVHRLKKAGVNFDSEGLKRKFLSKASLSTQVEEAFLYDVTREERILNTSIPFDEFVALFKKLPESAFVTVATNYTSSSSFGKGKAGKGKLGGKGKSGKGKGKTPPRSRSPSRGEAYGPARRGKNNSLSRSRSNPRNPYAGGPPNPYGASVTGKGKSSSYAGDASGGQWQTGGWFRPADRRQSRNRSQSPRFGGEARDRSPSFGRGSFGQQAQGQSRSRSPRGGKGKGRGSGKPQ